MFKDLYLRIGNGEFLVAGVIPALLLLLAYYLIYAILYRLAAKGHIKEYWLRTWRYLGWVLYLIAGYQPLRILFPHLSTSILRFGELFTQPLLGKEGSPSLLALLALVPIFFLANRLAAACGKLLGAYLERSQEKKEGGTEEGSKRLYASNIKALQTLSRYTLILLFCLFGINILGINLSSLGILLGALGLGIGFGLQNMAANFVSGITLLVTGNIQHGDFIRTKGAFGTVEHIGLLSTVVLTTKHENLIIPNQHLLNEIIENASYNNNRAVQLHMPLGVAYGSDLEQVVGLLQGVLQRNPYQLPKKSEVKQEAGVLPGGIHSLGVLGKKSTATTPKPNQNPDSGLQAGDDVWLTGFGASSIDFEVRMMIGNIDVFRTAKHWFYMEAWKIFQEHGVSIPFTQIDLHFHNTEKEAVQTVTGFGRN